MDIHLILLSFSWVLWCTLHSVLASGSVKKRQRLPRLAYNALAVVTLVPVVALFLTASASELGGRAVFDWPAALFSVQLLLWLAAGLLFVSTARQYDMWSFIGIRRPARASARDEAGSTVPVAGVTDLAPSFATQGALGLVRHPWYLAGMLILWSRDLSLADLTTNVLLSAYLVVGAVLEERKLVLEFGEGYRGYQSRVSMLIPVKWVLRKLDLARVAE